MPLPPRPFSGVNRTSGRQCPESPDETSGYGKSRHWRPGSGYANFDGHPKRTLKNGEDHPIGDRPTATRLFRVATPPKTA
jgi:hypothetical protein